MRLVVNFGFVFSWMLFSRDTNFRLDAGQKCEDRVSRKKSIRLCSRLHFHIFWSVSVLLHYSLFKDVNLSLRAVDNPQTTEVAAPGFSFETWHLTVYDGRTLDKLTGMERHRYDVSRRHMHDAVPCFVNQTMRYCPPSRVWH